MYKPVKPSEIITEYLDGKTVEHLAKGMDITVHEATKVLSGQVRINADLAERLAWCFETSTQYWLNLQTQYDQGAANANVSTQ